MQDNIDGNNNDPLGSERCENLDDEIDGDELHEVTQLNEPPAPVQMEEGKNGRFKRVICSLLDSTMI